MKTKVVMLFTVVIAVFSIVILAQESATEIAGQYMSLFFSGEYKQAFEMQSFQVKLQFGVKTMETAHNQIEQMFGSPVEIYSTNTQPFNEGTLVVFYTKFEQGYANVRIVVDKHNKIAQFLIQPAAPPEPLIPPYANPESFVEKEISIGKEPWVLKGYVTLPKGLENFPIAVLVPGSGPSDRDETVGPNKIFRDIAWGLSTHGIAVLRYDKRTYTYGKEISELASITIEDEYITDALAAVEKAVEIPGVNSLYIIGHSMGAELAPYIALRSDKVSGIIMLAPPARQLAQLSLSQNRYLAPITGISELQLQTIEIFFTKLLNHELPPDTPIDGGVTAAYYYDADNYPTIPALEKISLPVLVLQGEEDFQVTLNEDFLPIKEKFANKQNFTFKSFPGLNHLFLETEPGIQHSTNDYYKQGFVSEEVIEVMTNWIKELKRGH